MKRLNVELTVGAFVLAALVLFGYFSIKVGAADSVGSGGYNITAQFSDVGNLKEGSAVVIAGVPIGRVRDIALRDYKAEVRMAIAPGVKLQDDAIATVKSRGLLGESLIEITPGGSEVILTDGQRIRDTQPAIDLYGLVAKYIFSQKTGGGIE